MAIYDINGNLIISDENIVSIKTIKLEYPSYTDDQLLVVAIQLAQEKGKLSKIVWDGEDIHFSGSITHVCKGFGGIDFNNSTIYMPNYDGGTIIRIEPDSAEDFTVSASDIYSTYTTNEQLKGKVFRINETYLGGNTEMCLGDRMPKATYNQVITVSPVIKTSLDGFYRTGELFMTPTSGDVPCYNVHSFPDTTFEVCNAKVVAYASSNMSRLLYCSRSNTHVHHFMTSGRSTVSTYHDGVMRFQACSDIEIDHLYGENPIQEALTSGYIFSLTQVSNVYVHDVAIGDNIGWGAVGTHFITNSVFERCYLSRWDSHYAQMGYNVIRDCVLNRVMYGVGNGSILVENSTIVLSRYASNFVYGIITLRDDVVGVYDGDIIIRNCDILSGKQSVNMVGVFDDSCKYAKPSNSSFNLTPKKQRFISKCRIPDGCNYVFKTGTATTADQPMFTNLTYNIEDTIVGSGTTIMSVLGGQSATDAVSTDYHKKIG